MVDPALAVEDFCYVTTRRRVTGGEHTIEIWFGLDGDTLYMLSGGRDRSDWVRNVMRTPEVSVCIGTATFAGRARIMAEGTDEDALARRLLLEKYAPGYSGSLDDWGKNALPVAVELGDT